MSDHRFVATVARGAERALQEELSALGIPARAGIAPVRFQPRRERGLQD